MKKLAILFAAFIPFAVIHAAHAADNTSNLAFIESIRQVDPDSADYLALADHSLTLRCGQPPSLAYLRKIYQLRTPTIVSDDHATDRAQIATLSCE